MWKCNNIDVSIQGATTEINLCSKEEKWIAIKYRVPNNKANEHKFIELFKDGLDNNDIFLFKKLLNTIFKNKVKNIIL